MSKEIQSKEKSNTLELTTQLGGKKSISIKLIYKTKYMPSSKVQWFKVRLVVKDYKQMLGIEYFEVFVLIARWYINHMIIALASQKKWKFHQMDVK